MAPSASCPKWTVLLLLLMVFRSGMVEGAPRPNSKTSPNAGFRGLKGGSWGLKLDALPMNEINEKNTENVNKMIGGILSRNNSPAVRMLLKDNLFLHHLQLLIDRPSPRQLF